MSHELHYTAEWSALVESVFQGQAPVFLGTGEQLKGASAGFAGAFVTPLLSDFDERILTEDANYKSGNGSEQRLRIYELQENRHKGKVLVFFHGGGFVCGTLDLDAYDVSTIAAGVGLTCVSCDYRLAPEHQFPAAHDDAWEAPGWVQSRYPQANIIIAGSSAGAALATFVARKATEDTKSRIIGQLLLCPPLAPPGKAPGIGWTPAGGEDPRLHALLNTDFSMLPKTAILAPEHDVNFSDNAAYAQALQLAGVAVRFQVDQGLPHVHWLANHKGMAGQAHAEWLIEQTNWLLS